MPRRSNKPGTSRAAELLPSCSAAHSSAPPRPRSPAPAHCGPAQLGPPQRDSVWAQLYQAKDVDTEAGWLAVSEYFPNASLYQRNLAKQGLVYHYLHARDYNKARKPLEELVGQPDFQAFAIAGLVVVFANSGDDERDLKKTLASAPTCGPH